MRLPIRRKHRPSLSPPESPRPAPTPSTPNRAHDRAPHPDPDRALDPDPDRSLDPDPDRALDPDRSPDPPRAPARAPDPARAPAPRVPHPSPCYPPPPVVPPPPPPSRTFAGPIAELQSLARAWQERVTRAQLRALLAVTTVTLFLALLLARKGTVPWRIVALLSLLLPVFVTLALWLRERAVWSDPSRIIHRLAGKLDVERAGRAVRALALVQEPFPEGTSLELANMHVERTLRALPRERILGRLVQLGERYGRVTLLLAVLAVLLGAVRGFAIFEGGDVLCARHGRAPVPIVWLDGLEVEARPPEYLHEHDRLLTPYVPMALPHGCELTLRGVPLHAGRRLLLSDGASDVPFVDDGAGHVVARWPLTATRPLQVIARFGDVTIGEPEVTEVMSIEDERPTVTLDGAPREVRLANVGVAEVIPLKYEATDDHGLREVHLVLRSGAREERRILAHLDGETETSRGGHMLRASDPFIKKSHAPILVTVEAEDNDAVTGPKWGASPAITIIPPEVGEPEALRLDILRKLRDAFVDSLAARLARAFTVAVPERATLAKADQEGVLADDLLLDTTTKTSYAGLAVSGRTVALLRGHMRRVKEALQVELRSPGSASHARLVAATEKLVLVTDAVTRGLAQHDSRTVARTLADVADDLALGTSQMRRTADRDRGKLRADASVVVLEGGSRSLLKLGSLGRDLGEIVHMDLARVARARDQGDIVHAEIAASDLAARLKAPDPSFGAQGSSGGRAGGESGGGRGTPGEGEPSDDAEQAFEEAARDLQKLSSDHASELGKVEQELNDPETPEEAKATSEEGKSHAKAVRDATGPLPSVGAGSDSWTNKGAAAREHGEAMARALEEGNAGDAVSSGRSALDALDEARHIAQRERWTGLFSVADPDAERTSADQRLAAARAKLEPEVNWATEKLKELRKRASQRRKSEVMEHGNEEGRLADRTGALREKGEGPGALPGAALEALHQAERAAEEAAAALKRGDVDQGLAQQREAQRRLESAKDALGNESDEDPSGGNNGEEAKAGHADIPNATSHKGPEDFRRRVIDGLGQAAGGRQRDAVRRYADGLLR